MTDDEFITAVFMRHPDTQKVMQADLKKWLNGFTGEDISDLHEKYLLSQSSRFPPKSLFDFQSLATENGITKKSDDVMLLWWKCQKCGAQFSRQSRGCPRCESKQFDGRMGRRFPTEIIFVKDGCYRCKKYKSGFRPQGPSCAEYGTIDNGVKRPDDPVQVGMCKGCQCAVCCAEEYAARNHDKDRLNALSGKAMPAQSVPVKGIGEW